MLGNELHLEENQLTEYVIDGMNNPNLQCQARMRDFASLNDLLRVMSRLSPEECRMERTRSTQQGPSTPRDSQQRPIMCFNCNKFGHQANVCRKPKRAPGSCFECGKNDHQLRTALRREFTTSATTFHPFMFQLRWWRMVFISTLCWTAAAPSPSFWIVTLYDCP